MSFTMKKSNKLHSKKANTQFEDQLEVSLTTTEWQ